MHRLGLHRPRRRFEAEILEGAETVFRSKGYRNATMEDIAKEAGLSVGTLYNGFSSKDELYAAVIERTGQRALSRIEEVAEPCRTPQQAIETIVRSRLANHAMDRLFFQPLVSEGDLRFPPSDPRITPALARLYDRYVRLASRQFKRVLAEQRVAGPDPGHLLVSMEGMINAFASYWAGPVQSHTLCAAARQITESLVGPILLRRMAAEGNGTNSGAGGGEAVFISSYDLERLRELIDVARCFGDHAAQPHLDALEASLAQANVVKPSEAPAGLVTMNSRVRLADAATGSAKVVSLRFPREAGASLDGVSILEPLGTALLGRREGEAFACLDHGAERVYRVEAVLYQPEAAQDYHL